MDVNGTPIAKFVSQLRDDAARIRGNIEARPNLDQTDPATFNDMAYTQAIFDMAATTLEKLLVSDAELTGLAMEIRDQLLADMNDRSGFSNCWDEMDSELRDEMRNDWKKMVFNRLRDYRDGIQ